MVDIVLTIPTYRNSHVVKTIEEYDKNFSDYSKEIPILVFDDSPERNYLDVKTKNPLFYIGPEEKAKYLYHETIIINDATAPLTDKDKEKRSELRKLGIMILSTKTFLKRYC